MNREQLSIHSSKKDKVRILLPVPGSTLSTKFTGSYIVERKLSETNYVIKTPDHRQRSRMYHANMIRQFCSREDREGSSAAHDIQTVSPVASVSRVNLPEDDGDDLLMHSATPQVARLSNSEVMSDLFHHLSHLSDESSYMISQVCSTTFPLKPLSLLMILFWQTQLQSNSMYILLILPRRKLLFIISYQIGPANFISTQMTGLVTWSHSEKFSPVCPLHPLHPFSTLPNVNLEKALRFNLVSRFVKGRCVLQMQKPLPSQCFPSQPSGESCAISLEWPATIADSAKTSPALLLTALTSLSKLYTLSQAPD